jgi:hypothetical protein
MTFNEAKALTHGQIIYYRCATNADGTPMRAKVMGRVKLWKRSPERIQIPMKRGLRETFHVTEDDLENWSLDEGEAQEILDAR